MTTPPKDAFAYQEVYHYLLGLIEAASGTTEQKLPSLRQLALRLGVSVSTTKYAYALLEDEGRIHAKARLGYFTQPIPATPVTVSTGTLLDNLNTGAASVGVTIAFMGIYLVSTVAAILAPTIELLIAARFMQGVGIARNYFGNAVCYAEVRYGEKEREVVGGELPQLHQQHAAGHRERRVARAGWVAQVGADRVVAGLVRKHTLEHQDFLAAAVGVRIKARAGCITHHAGGTCHLVAHAVEQAALHPGQG